MEAAISSVSASQPVAQSQPDLRPTADAAALARDPRPELAMAIPANMGQSGAVNAARMTDTGRDVTATVPVERMLKPYGVAMLPDAPHDTGKDASDDANDTTDQGQAEA